MTKRAIVFESDKLIFIKIYISFQEIKSTNILDSNLRVETSMKNGIVQRSDAMEDYIYVPFSSGSSGAKAQVVTKIVLKETKAGFNIQGEKNINYTNFSKYCYLIFKNTIQ